MNCEECKEQVFELIEREAIDPDAVHQILEGCPDCLAEFEETKAALRLAALLPVEEPGAAIDAAILRAASSRGRRLAPLRKGPIRAAPWAVAAVAILAVGIGVLAIPRRIQLESEGALSETNQTADTHLAEQAGGETPLPEDEASGVRLGESKTRAVGGGPAPAAAKSMTADSSAQPEKREAKSPSESTPEALARARSAEADFDAPAAASQAGDADVMARCRRRIAALERQEQAERDLVRRPEEELAIGKCYQTLGNVAKARQWLKRAAAHRRTRARAEEALRGL
ncbi:MAG: hypothetical protein WCE62_11645 [Polyangiales bacterium]